MQVEHTSGPLKQSLAGLHPGIWLDQSLGSGGGISLAFQQTLRRACIAGGAQHGFRQRTLHGICGTFWVTATCTKHMDAQTLRKQAAWLVYNHAYSM